MASGGSFSRSASPAWPSPPPAQGLYDPKREHDACGVGFVADLKGRPSHKIVEHGIQILENLTHRGATGADPLAGDGAGILVQIPHEFLKAVTAPLKIKLPEPGHYAVGHMFMPRNRAQRIYCESVVARVVDAEGLKLLGWRDVPSDNSCLSASVIETEPTHRQVFIGRGADVEDENDFERRLYVLRKVISNTINGETGGRDIGFYTVSLSCRTLVYKGMFLAYQLGAYYPDLHHPLFASALALVHQRFSTNTFPSWKLAHPYRMVAHNGEINTLRGNLNWMAARQASVSSPLFGPDIAKLWPISYEGQSDTACFDNALEFLVQGGYSLAHAAMMLIPEAWAGNPLMDAKRRAFYEYHACLMEPWDGPAAMAFTDGRQIGATLDRNGLRPARYLVTDDGLVIMASETGVLPIAEETIVEKWRLQPGKMLLIDLEKGCIVSDEEIKAELASAHPYQQWLDRTQIRVHELPGGAAPAPRTNVSLLDRQQAFGYTQESTKFLMLPMAEFGQEAVGSMGTDTPISALSNKPKLLHTYFKQNFAQVTNPPIDPIREELVMSLVTFIGPRPNLLDLEGTSKQKRLEAAHPILTNDNLERIRGIGEVADNQFRTVTLDITYGADHGAAGMGKALDKLCKRAEEAVRAGENIIILSDRATGPDRVPIPSLLATSAVHHHLIRCGLADLGRPRGRDRRGARGASIRDACRLWRRGDQSLSRLRDHRGDAARARRGAHARGSGQALHQGDRQGPAQGHVEDGHLDLSVLLRRADLRCGGPQVRFRRQIFHRHQHPGRGRGTGGDRARDRRAAQPSLLRCACVARGARGRRRICLSRARRGAYVAAASGRRSAACRPWQPAREVPRLRQADQRADRAAADAARHVPHQDRRGDGPQADPARSGRARQGYRQALLHRGHVVRLDQPRGAHHARHRHEPHRRQVEHRRRRRGSPTATSRCRTATRCARRSSRWPRAASA